MQMFVFQSSISISGSIWLIWLKVLPFWLKGWQTRSPQLVYTVQHVKQSNSIQYTCLYSIQFILSNMSNSPLCNTVQHVKQSNQPTSNVPKGRVNQIWRRTTIGTYSLIIIIILQYLFTIFYTICGNILEYIQKRTTTRTETKTILTTQQKEGRMVIW